MNFTEEGEGPPLLLIQGLGYPADLWARLVPFLAPRHRVITFDNRGFGRNAGLEVDGLTIEQMADDAATVIGASGETSVDVLGTSLGGIVAQELALRHPALVRRLVLLSTHTSDEHAVPAEDSVLQMLATRSSLAGEASLRASVPYAYARSTPAAHIDEDIAVRARWMPDAAAYDAQLAAAERYRGSWERLAGLRAATLVIHGTDDLIVPPQNATRIAERIPGARLVWVRGGGHNLFSERAEEVGNEVVSFLA